MLNTSKKVKKITYEGVEFELAMPRGNYTCRLYDWDGTILKEEHLNSGDYFILSDTSPSHENLVFSGYSSSEEISDNKILVADNDVAVGVLYNTEDGQTFIYITLTNKTGLTVTINGDGSKNWGDGTTDELTTHTYSDYGDYVIEWNGSTITSSSQSGLFGQNESAPNYYCTKIISGTSLVNVPEYAFSNCNSLQYVSLAQSITSIGAYAFKNDSNLRHFTIPNQVESISVEMFNGCWSLVSVVLPKSIKVLNEYCLASNYSLMDVVLPDGIEEIWHYSFYNNYAIRKIVIPNNVVSIGRALFFRSYALEEVVVSENMTMIETNTFSYCSSIKKIIIPKSIKTISSKSFTDCLSILLYNFSNHESIPTLSHTDAFAGINGICKIIVPDALYDTWITATNWSTYADYIYKASEVNL